MTTKRTQEPAVPTLVSVFAEMEAANSIEELRKSFDEFVRELGLTTFQLSEITDPDNFPGTNLSFGTLPAAYIKQYWERGNDLFHDPMIRAILSSNQPVRLRQMQTSHSPNKLEQQILEQRKKQGVQDGYGFPLKGRLNRLAMVTVHGDVSRFDRADLARIELLCIMLYRRATELTPLPEHLQIPKHAQLTTRERECLSWVAKGKTNWDISQILMITERTVQYHVENACEKLGAGGRLQAVVIAARKLEIIL
ncbi:hypothetical protein MNBD_ALPHA06-2278 [hydrothermal vent metagenome]|uniref:HTH luxR-type domain-containing protein n=1 Tax=hydrothermal vent metagenome TaxID=652676 RepID=A0A3B0SHH8_9ZZZZ